MNVWLAFGFSSSHQRYARLARRKLVFHKCFSPSAAPLFSPQISLDDAVNLKEKPFAIGHTDLTEPPKAFPVSYKSSYCNI
jgi:hypothetical protein